MPAERERARGVVLIMTDTQNKNMLGCYGNPEMNTPSLDRLAGQGVRFENAYCCQPVCTPARGAIFTGMYPHANGAWANQMAFAKNVQSVGRRLRDVGVHTAYVGKWHLDGGDYFGTGQCADGWDPDYWYDMRNYLEELTPEECRLSRDPTTNRTHLVTPEFTFGHRVSDRAIDFLDRHAREDFLLVVSYDEPHHPWLCPPPFSEMYRDYEVPRKENVWDDLSGKPEHHRVWAEAALSGRDEESRRITKDDFFCCNAFVDSEIGRVLDAVDRRAPEALVIYTTDHGEFLLEHGLNGKGAAMYEEITNIPLMVRWPGRVPEGAVCDSLVSHVDLVPTIMEAMGRDVSPRIQGNSMLAALNDPSRQVRDVAFVEFNRFNACIDGGGGFQPIRACFDGRHKLVINLIASDELYDLAGDPGEMINLIEDPEHAEVRDRLHGRILDWMEETRDPFRGYYWARRPWRDDAPPPTWGGSGRRFREADRYNPADLSYGTGLPPQ